MEQTSENTGKKAESPMPYYIAQCVIKPFVYGFFGAGTVAALANSNNMPVIVPDSAAMYLLDHVRSDPVGLGVKAGVVVRGLWFLVEMYANITNSKEQKKLQTAGRITLENILSVPATMAGAIAGCSIARYITG